MKCSLGISNFLEEISSLSHSVVFLYFFALIAEGGFLIKGRQGSRVSIPDSPGESGLAWRGSKGLSFPLNSRHGSLGAH